MRGHQRDTDAYRKGPELAGLSGTPCISEEELSKALQTIARRVQGRCVTNECGGLPAPAFRRPDGRLKRVARMLLGVVLRRF